MLFLCEVFPRRRFYFLNDATGDRRLRDSARNCPILIGASEPRTTTDDRHRTKTTSKSRDNSCYLACASVEQSSDPKGDQNTQISWPDGGSLDGAAQEEVPIILNRLSTRITYSLMLNYDNNLHTDLYFQRLHSVHCIQVLCLSLLHSTFKTQ